MNENMQKETVEKNLNHPVKPSNSSFFRNLLIVLAVLFYTIIVIGVTVGVDRKIISNNLQKSFQEAFNVESDSPNKIENKIGKEEKEPEKEVKKLNIGQTVTIGDVMELTLASSEWCDEINPSNTSGFYSYCEDIEGEKYFVIKGKVKNIAGEDLDLDYVNQSKIIVNDTYKADVRFEAEESDGTSFYADVKPLQTLNFVAYASLSDEAYNICEKIRCDLDIVNDSAYINEFFSNSTPHDSFYIEFEN